MAASFRSSIEAQFGEALATSAGAGKIWRMPHGGLLIAGPDSEPPAAEAGVEPTLLYDIEDGVCLYDFQAEAIIEGLRKLARSDEQIRLAVLYGSRAWGDPRPLSDADVMVARRRTTWQSAYHLGSIWGLELGIEVQVRGIGGSRAAVFEATRDDPTWWADMLEAGEVLIDRDELWPALQAKATEINAAADKDLEKSMRETYEALEEMKERMKKDAEERKR